LNLNPCNKRQFSCNDGSCINIDARCDGGADCKPGGEDEIGCNLLNLNDSYVPGIPPWGNNSIVLSMTILDIQEVNVLDGLLKAHLEINLVWSDSRLLKDKNLNVFPYYYNNEKENILI
jgi:hypothetical protein